jgi:predicted RNase H-like nuclease (RuvC/YqgF family)
METKEQEVAERLEAAAAQLERSLAWLEERQNALSGQVEKISATVEQTRREEELEQKLAEAEREIAELKAAAKRNAGEERSAAGQLDAAEAGKPSPVAASPVRRTVPAATTEMLAKHGIGDGPVDVKTLDAALNGLSLEQRIAVKSQLHRAGAI